jgi:hypothetical protein
LPGFSIIALTLIAVLPLLAVIAAVAVWRIRSLAAGYCGGIIALIGVVAAVAIGWIVFVSPVYVD